ncbi:hypothetical protein [Legionella brunensis]|uniref:Uncharacterized protein n=1 Tax=Legionella brunensis TaxID=29422 RepID=A0A0W0SDG1_9GAMM|nr:hypothetical protein [Legionella brunensis]KTC81523.1 hypothetical protein Lbru_2043 [Legionella brunensis]
MPTIFPIIENKEKNKDIALINEAIKGCNEEFTSKGRVESDTLETLISAINWYIKTIPLNVRQKSPEETWEEQLKLYPQAIQILEIQKKAVVTMFLPEADTKTKARWSLIKGLISPKTNLAYPGKMMDPAYWPEAIFAGNTYVHDWLTNATYDTQNYFRSFLETIVHNQKITGIDRRYVTYVENPKKYKLDFGDGLFYFAGHPIDTKNSDGVATERGTVIFAASKDGSIYTNNPSSSLDIIFHHSAFLQGKSALCAGTLKFKEGKLVEITVSSGHYKPTRANLVNFLDLLKNHYHLDLSQIRVKTHGGSFRNAEKFYKTNGACLPDNKADLMWEHALDAFYKKDEENLHFFLDKAIALGHEEALFSKANFMVNEQFGYKNQQKEGIKILQSLQSNPRFRFHIKNLLSKVLPKDVEESTSAKSLQGAPSQKLQTIIENASLEYRKWKETKTVSFLKPKTTEKIQEIMHLVTKSKNLSFPKMINLIQDFFAAHSQDQHNTGKVVSNHSFISFFLNELKNHGDVVEEMARYLVNGKVLQKQINKETDYTNTSAMQAREQLFQIFSDAGKAEIESQNKYQQ